MNDLKKYLPLLFLSCILFMTGLSSCEGTVGAQQPQITSPQDPTSKSVEPIQEVQDIPMIITYHLDSIGSAAEVDSFKAKFSELEQEYIFAINRIDAYRLNSGDRLVIPDTLTTNFLDYSPFPNQFEMLDSIPKTLLISRRVQAFAIYEHGNLIRWGPVSSGKQTTPTPAGLFYANYKARSKISTVNEDWIMPYYFNFMNFEGVGVHQYSMPGYPASHACVRLRQDDAVFIYNWADQWKLDASRQAVKRNGTPVMVYGDYDFDSPVPWFQLAENPHSNYLNAEEMATLKSYVTRYKKEKRNFAPMHFPAEELAVSGGEGLETIQ
ncbi:L,D-transpeptidase [Salinimicrobium sp. CAU 1759]